MNTNSEHKSPGFSALGEAGPVAGKFNRLAKLRTEFRRGNPNISGGEILDRSGNRVSGTQLEEIIARANAAPTLLRQVSQLREALAGVVRVADRKTIEFDAARAALTATQPEARP